MSSAVVTLLNLCEAIPNLHIRPSSVNCCHSNMLDIVGTMIAVLVIFFVSGAESGPCPLDTIGLNVTSEADIHTLTQVFNCTGQGSFHVRWDRSLTLDQRVDIPSNKNVTITGSGFPTIRGGLGVDERDEESIIDRENGTTGVFSVANESTLLLSHLMFAGGRAEDGGAVYLYPSSTLFVSDCTFSNNKASYGGKTVHFIVGRCSIVYATGIRPMTNILISSAVWGIQTNTATF